MKISLCSFFNLSARCEWAVNARLWSLYTRERPGAHCVGNWLGPRATLAWCGKCLPLTVVRFPLQSRHSDSLYLLHYPGRISNIYKSKANHITGLWGLEDSGRLRLQITRNSAHEGGHVMHQQFNIQQLYVLPTLYLCILYISENKQRLAPLTA